MMTRALVTAVMSAVFCIGMVVTSDSAHAAKRARRAVCEPALPGRICPPLQFSRCVPCKLKGGIPGCAWTPCGPLGR
jgi:hypothetical protein